MTNVQIHAIHHTKLMIIIGYAIGAPPFFFNMQMFVNTKKHRLKWPVSIVHAPGGLLFCPGA